MDQPVYSVNGSFGQVRDAGFISSPADRETLACIISMGWHSCNDLYKITRGSGDPLALLFFTIAGEGTLELFGQAYSLRPGSVTLVPPCTAVSYYTPPGGNWEFYWIHPVGDLSDRLFSRLTDAVISAGQFPVFSEPCHDIFTERIEELLFLHASRPANLPVRVSGVYLSLIHELLLKIEKTAASHRPALCATAIQHMENHYEQPLNIARLSALLYLSPSHFIRVFRKETGYTPHEYLTRLRIVKAGHLLRYTDRPIGEIARMVGFNQTSNFIIQYRRLTGTTPGAMRKSGG